MKHSKPYANASVKGFTLLELIVASALAVIVIMAAGSTYFVTRKLSHSAQQRADVQQNLRNAATQIMRDSRLAGGFGCYNTGNDSSIVHDIDAPDFSQVKIPNVLIDPNETDGFGVRIGKFDSHMALFFVYGQGEIPIQKINTLTQAEQNNIQSLVLSTGTRSTIEHRDTDNLYQTLHNRGPVVLTSCHSAVAFNAPNNNGVTINTQLNNAKFTLQDSAEITLNKLHAVAYVFNEASKQLFRVELGTNGQWQTPQLLLNRINSMNIGFGYTDQCPSTPASAPETYTFANHTAQKKLPAIVQILLNYDLNVGNNSAPANANYLINATVRGGNTCGSRIPLSEQQ